MRLLVLACLIGITGCGSDSVVGPTVPLNQTFTLAVGEMATIDRTRLAVQFVGVTGDSRCPADVVCVQGGDATVHVRVIEGGASRAYELHTGDSSRAFVVHAGIRFELVSLQPYPFRGRPVAPAEYRTTLTARAA
jgi:hypothetical protein